MGPYHSHMFSKHLSAQSKGEYGKEVQKSVQAGWRKVSGAMCDKRVSARMKGKVCKMVVRPVVLYGGSEEKTGGRVGDNRG